MIIADDLWGDAHNAADVTVIKTHLVEDNEEDVGGAVLGEYFFWMRQKEGKSTAL